MASANRVLFRADGSSSLGLGHIIRCIALADMLKEEFNCLFIVNRPDTSVVNLVTPFYDLFLIDCCDQKEELAQLKDIILPSDIFVADGYAFGEDYQLAIRQLAYRLVMIDDKAEHSFYADAIFNHGDISTVPAYRTSATTQIYSGIDYVILRKEFLEAATVQKTIDKVETAFICMGGSDPFDITIKVLKAISHCDFIKNLVLVTGSAYENHLQLNELLSGVKDKVVTHLQNASAPEIVRSITRSELAITTASSIALEVCCVKAALICGTVIDNQYAIHSQLIKSGCCCSAGDWRTASEESIINLIGSFSEPERANEMIAIQGRYIDGKSAQRISAIFKRLAA